MPQHTLTQARPFLSQQRDIGIAYHADASGRLKRAAIAYPQLGSLVAAASKK